MKTAKNNFTRGVIKFINYLSLFLVVQTANSACIWLAYQPEFPEEANRYKKR